jgi:hypothetical protein
MLVFFFFGPDKICKCISSRKGWVSQLTQRVGIFGSKRTLQRFVIHASLLDVFCSFTAVSNNFGEGEIFEPTFSDGSSFCSRSMQLQQQLLHIITVNLVRYWYAHSGECKLDNSVVVSIIVLCDSIERRSSGGFINDLPPLVSFKVI